MAYGGLAAGILGALAGAGDDVRYNERQQAELQRQQDLIQMQEEARFNYQKRLSEWQMQAANDNENAIDKGAKGILAQGNLDQYNQALRAQNPDNPQLTMDEYQQTTDYANNPAPTQMEEQRARIQAASGVSKKAERDAYDKMLKDERDNRRIDLQEDRNNAQMEFNNRQEVRRQALAEAQMAAMKSSQAHQDERDRIIDAREARAATAKALDGVNSEIKALQKEMADPSNSSPEQQKVYQVQMQSLKQEAQRYRSTLAGAGLSQQTGSGKDNSKWWTEPKEQPKQAAPQTQTPKPASPTAPQPAPSKVETYAEGLARQNRQQAEWDQQKEAQRQVAIKAEQDRKEQKRAQYQNLLETWQRNNPNPEPGSNAYNQIEALKNTLKTGRY